MSEKQPRDGKVGDLIILQTTTVEGAPRRRARGGGIAATAAAAARPAWRELLGGCRRAYVITEVGDAEGPHEGGQPTKEFLCCPLSDSVGVCSAPGASEAVVEGLCRAQRSAHGNFINEEWALCADTDDSVQVSADDRDIVAVISRHERRAPAPYWAPVPPTCVTVMILTDDKAFLEEENGLGGAFRFDAVAGCTFSKPLTYTIPSADTATDRFSVAARRAKIMSESEGERICEEDKKMAAARAEKEATERKVAQEFAARRRHERTIKSNQDIAAAAAEAAAQADAAAAEAAVAAEAVKILEAETAAAAKVKAAKVKVAKMEATLARDRAVIDSAIDWWAAQHAGSGAAQRARGRKRALAEALGEVVSGGEPSAKKVRREGVYGGRVDAYVDVGGLGAAGARVGALSAQSARKAADDARDVARKVSLYIFA
jgi:hypothetical protein